jgi:plastocyanin
MPPLIRTITAAGRDSRFVPSSFTTVSGLPISVVFLNEDAGVPHDLTLFGPSGAELGATATFVGPGTASFDFDASVSGRYPFKCSVHPTQMTGVVVVQ